MVLPILQLELLCPFRPCIGLILIIGMSLFGIKYGTWMMGCTDTRVSDKTSVILSQVVKAVAYRVLALFRN